MFSLKQIIFFYKNFLQRLSFLINITGLRYISIEAPIPLPLGYTVHFLCWHPSVWKESLRYSIQRITYRYCSPSYLRMSAIPESSFLGNFADSKLHLCSVQKIVVRRSLLLSLFRINQGHLQNIVDLMQLGILATQFANSNEKLITTYCNSIFRLVFAVISPDIM